MVERVRYEVEGWGLGELGFDGGTLAWHELPVKAGVRSGFHPLAGRLQSYFAGVRDSFADVELELTWCTPFQRRVVETLRAIPYGETATYGEVAALAGHPNAQRAVGSVCACNRFALVVPCHRVVAADGLGSYGSLGLGYKRRLLELEGVAL
jgi:methylated-DNA-[protein]-cysteine S-methyltransferase